MVNSESSVFLLLLFFFTFFFNQSFNYLHNRLKNLTSSLFSICLVLSICLLVICISRWEVWNFTDWLYWCNIFVSAPSQDQDFSCFLLSSCLCFGCWFWQGADNILLQLASVSLFFNKYLRVISPSPNGMFYVSH